MTFPFTDTIVAGHRIIASEVLAWRNALAWTVVRQTSDQTKTSNTTLINTNIVIPIGANEILRIDLYGQVTAGATGDIKLAWTVPSGVTGIRKCIGPAASATGGPLTYTDVKFRATETLNDNQVYGGSTGFALHEHLRVASGATAGNIVLQFAQNTSDATSTIWQAASYAQYLRIG